jgi:DNA-binding NtrC family response regulator
MVGSSVTESDRQNAAGRDASSARDPLSIPADVKASIRILLVDDERTLRESCASVLQMDGFSVALAGRGEEARDLLRNRKFDIVLVDLYMSQVSGLELLRAGLEANRDLIVAVTTGHPSVTTSTEAHRAGAWDYLPKPFSATHLQVLIGRASHAVMVNREAAELRQQIIQQHSHSDDLALVGLAPV